MSMIKILPFLLLLVSCRPEPMIDQGFLSAIPAIEAHSFSIDVPEEGLYEAGQKLEFSFTANTNFSLQGSPSLSLEISSNERLASCSQEAPNKLLCSYTLGSAGPDYAPKGEIFVKGLSLGDAVLTTIEGAEIELDTDSNLLLSNRVITFKGPLLWLDASDASTTFSDTSCSTKAAHGDAVRCWTDKFDSVPFVASTNTALLEAGELNGKNIIDFTRDLFLAPSPMVLDNFTAFVVYDVKAWSALNYLIGSVNDVNPGIGLGFGGSWTGTQGQGIFVFGKDGFGAEGNVSAPVEPTSWGLATYYNDKTFYGAHENAPYASEVPVPQGLSFQGIGSREDFHSCCSHKGGVAEIIIFNAPLTDAERKEVWCEISGKYGLNLSGC